MSLNQSRLVCAMLAWALLGTVMGCADDPPPAMEVMKLHELGIWYARYTALNDGVGPPSADDLKEFIAAQDSTAEIEAMFTSARDGEALVVVPAQEPAARRAEMLPTVMAFERTGYGGRRYVVTGGPTVEEMEDERLAEILPAGITLP